MNHHSAIAAPTASAGLALTSILAFAAVTGACDVATGSYSGVLPSTTAWRVVDGSQTVVRTKMKVAPRTPLMPKTQMARDLAALRARIVAAGATKPAAALLAEIQELRGEQ